ncbi:hypothetical protein Rsub_07401 [Raphidocelis subcapitata]|uniref:AP2/ERF domain-containing protein n=1 Tax=Raphidocelis subcapitata TaxID=307507 RepID=A0A2V0PC34_9CHLO|nr:hypothetical protein Rsub_07401 [Raphidocelis subcapitata]|eukprot:GBF94665.1 hypothetical protein Rsub_07401 [Raphidocelis subcapitata]
MEDDGWETPTPSGSLFSRSEQTPEPHNPADSPDAGGRRRARARSQTPASAPRAQPAADAAGRSPTPGPASRESTPRAFPAAEAGGRNRHGFRGVRQRPWVGTYGSAAEAARAYDAAALALHGSSTRTNFRYSRDTLSAYPAHVPKNDAAAVAALQAVIDGTAEMPEPDDPLYAEAFEAALAAEAEAAGGAGGEGAAESLQRMQARLRPARSSAGAPPPAAGDVPQPQPQPQPHAAANAAAIAQQHQQRQFDQAQGAFDQQLAAAVAFQGQPFGVAELHGMPISVPRVRTTSQPKPPPPGQAGKPLASAAAAAAAADSPPHSGHSQSLALSGAARFALDAGFGDARPGSPATPPARKRAAREGDSSDGSARGAPSPFAYPLYSTASASPPAAAGGGPSPPPRAPGGAAPDTPSNATPAAGAPRRRAAPGGVPLFAAGPRAGQKRRADEAGFGGDDDGYVTPHFGSPPRRPAGGARGAAAPPPPPALALGGAFGGFGREGDGPAAAAGDSPGEEEGDGDAMAVDEPEPPAPPPLRAALLADAARDALLSALRARRQQEEFRAAAQAAAFGDLQRRNAATIATLRQVVSLAGPGGAEAALKAMAKLPDVQTLLRSVQAAAPGLVASVVAEQRAVAERRAEEAARAAAEAAARAEAARLVQLMGQPSTVQLLQLLASQGQQQQQQLMAALSLLAAEEDDAPRTTARPAAKRRRSAGGSVPVDASAEAAAEALPLEALAAAAEMLG